MLLVVVTIFFLSDYKVNTFSGLYLNRELSAAAVVDLTHLLEFRLFYGDNFTLKRIILVLKLFYKLLRRNPA